MPTLLIEGPFRFWWYAADRTEPPHVHVERDDLTAKFWLDPVRLAKPSRMPSRDLRKILQLVIEHRDEWLERWTREIGR